MLHRIRDDLYCFPDTCHVYIIKRANQAVLIDFGTGDVLDRLQAIGVEEVSAILMTHHHRDQAQGLPRAVEAGIPIYVPHTEQDLFHSVDAHWQARTVMNSYDNRQDRFSLLNAIPTTGTLRDYASYTFADQRFTIIPTPGHTVGSISIETQLDDTQVIFSGDLIAGYGKIWSLAATQWSYNGAEGVAASIPSLLELKKRQPHLLLPSHGDMMEKPEGAIDALVERLSELLQYRQERQQLFDVMAQPYREILPHLLLNKTSISNSYVVLSESGKALMIDFGYDFSTGEAAGYDRSSRRPLLYTLEKLKEQYGVTEVDVVMPTHYHDDHIAGINLLRDVEGTQCWTASNFSDILVNPTDYDLPCLWYDPIPVDRVLPLETSIQWEEYTFTLYELSGHTHYAVAIEFEVDGKRVLATGDQYEGSGDRYNYVFKNDYQLGDYVHSADLYRRLQPDIIISGHWQPLFVAPEYYDRLAERGQAVERLHRELLPLEQVELGAQGFAGRIRPYQVFANVGETFELQVEVHNPFPHAAETVVKLVAPAGWTIAPAEHVISIPASANVELLFNCTPSPQPIRRARVAADITVDKQRFGQQAEALVTVLRHGEVAPNFEPIRLVDNRSSSEEPLSATS